MLPTRIGLHDKTSIPLYHFIQRWRNPGQPSWNRDKYLPFPNLDARQNIVFDKIVNVVWQVFIFNSTPFGHHIVFLLTWYALAEGQEKQNNKMFHGFSCSAR